MRNLGFDFKLPARFPGHTPITNLELNTASLTGLYEVQEIDGLITSLTNAGVAEVVAEPTLVVQDGHAANFLAGGEFPYRRVWESVVRPAQLRFEALALRCSSGPPSSIRAF